MTIVLEVMRCSAHSCYAIGIGRDQADRRITPSKCCGSWDTTVARWSIGWGTLLADIFRGVAEVQP